MEEVEVLKIYSTQCMVCDHVESYTPEILYGLIGTRCTKCQGTVYMFYNGNQEEEEAFL